MTHQIDLLDRVTGTDYPGEALDIVYAYDTGAFGKGRLSSISRNGGTVTYAYDRFGRILQDGALAYGYDANGNRAEITYPGGVKAVYTHDFADREATLSYQAPGESPVPLVTASSYKPLGPLSALALGNGLTESRTFNARYNPAGITVPGRLAWTYTTDRVGNVTAIADVLNSSPGRTYSYQDFHYFLTRGDGPWGTRSWNYDRIGNRLTETKGGVTETYSYTLDNGALTYLTTDHLGAPALATNSAGVTVWQGGSSLSGPTGTGRRRWGFSCGSRGSGRTGRGGAESSGRFEPMEGGIRSGSLQATFRAMVRGKF